MTPKTRDELRQWLDDKPSSWSVILALRATLRALPFAFSARRKAGTRFSAGMALSLFRATSISAHKTDHPAVESDELYEAALAASGSARLLATSAAIASSIPNRDVAYAAADAAAHIADAVRATDDADYTAYAAIDAIDSAARAAAAFYVQMAVPDLSGRVDMAARIEFRDAMNSDCQWLDLHVESGELRYDFAFELGKLPLWPSTKPEWFAYSIGRMETELREMPASFGLWWDWYQRRIEGYSTNFALPEAEDAEMSRRLVAQNDEWWSRDPTEVNADIQSWLDELTPDPDDALIDTVTAQLDAGHPLDFFRPEAQAVRTELLEATEAAKAALQERLTPGAGHNYFETSDELEIPTRPEPLTSQLLGPPRLTHAETVTEVAEYQVQLSAAENNLRKEVPDARELVGFAAWLKGKLDTMRQISPDGMKAFEAKMGEQAATGIGWLISKGLAWLASIITVYQLVLKLLQIVAS